MKIGLVSTNLYSVPPKGLEYRGGEWAGGYGGESQCYTLAKALNKLGHEVILFATAGSKMPENGNLHYLPQGSWTDEFLKETYTIQLYEKELKDCDLLHDWSLTKYVHNWAYNNFGKQCVMTPWGTWQPPQFLRYNGVFWSKFHRGLGVSQGYPETTKYVYGSVDTEVYQPNYEPENYMLYLSRMHPSKQPKLVVELAKKMKFKLVMACDRESPDHVVFLNEIADLTRNDDNIKIVVDPPLNLKLILYRNAKAFILPSLSECFGLVIVESLASGTPCILNNEGAYPELIEHGVHGFLCSGFDQYERAINNIDMIDRRRCRERAEKLFSGEVMAKQYLKVYEEVADGVIF